MLSREKLGAQDSDLSQFPPGVPVPSRSCCLHNSGKGDSPVLPTPFPSHHRSSPANSQPQSPCHWGRNIHFCLSSITPTQRPALVRACQEKVYMWFSHESIGDCLHISLSSRCTIHFQITRFNMQGIFLWKLLWIRACTNLLKWILSKQSKFFVCFFFK